MTEPGNKCGPINQLGGESCNPVKYLFPQQSQNPTAIPFVETEQTAKPTRVSKSVLVCMIPQQRPGRCTAVLGQYCVRSPSLLGKHEYHCLLSPLPTPQSRPGLANSLLHIFALTATVTNQLLQARQNIDVAEISSAIVVDYFAHSDHKVSIITYLMFALQSFEVHFWR